MWATVAAAAVAVVYGALAAGDWLVNATSATEAQDDACPNPPCLPTSLPDSWGLVVAIAPVLALLGALLGGLVLLVALRHALRGSAALVPVGLILAVAPVVLLAGAEVVPHLVTPCWLGEIDGMCVKGTHGIDYVDRLHPLSHALVGWVPLAAGYLWLVRRRWPELVRRRPNKRRLPNTG